MTEIKNNITILNIVSMDHLFLNDGDKKELIKDIKEVCVELRDNQHKPKINTLKQGDVEFIDVGCRTEKRFFIISLSYSIKFPNKIYCIGFKEYDGDTYANIAIESFQLNI